MATDWDRELEDLQGGSGRRWRRLRWLAIPLAVLAVAGIAVVAYEIGRNHTTKKKPAATRLLKNPDRASCAQIGFQNTRFPRALPSYNVQTASTLANGYIDTGSDPRVIKSAFALMLLSICNKTRDPAYRPEGQARSLAERARELSVQTQDDFAQTLITLAGTEARGKEQLTADTSFVQEAGTICNQKADQIRGLLHKVSDPTGAFKSADARQLTLVLDSLLARLQQLANRSHAANARSFSTDFTGRVRDIERQTARLGRLNDHWKKNSQRAAFVANGIAQKQLDFRRTTDKVHDCGSIFELA